MQKYKAELCATFFPPKAIPGEKMLNLLFDKKGF